MSDIDQEVLKPGQASARIENAPKPDQDQAAAVAESDPPPLRLGIVPRDELTGDEYHRLPGISKSGLSVIGQSPLHYITYKYNPKPATPALFFGAAYHHLILEPETFADHYVPEPFDAPKRPTIAQINAAKPSPQALDSIAFWTEFDAVNKDKRVIATSSDPDRGIWGRSDWDTLHFMRDALLDPVLHQNICLLLAPHLLDEPGAFDRSSGGPSELSAFIVDNAAPFAAGFQYEPTHKLVKARLDKLNTDHNIVVDLKTAIDASFSGFARAAAEFEYHIQHAMYLDVMRQAGQPAKAFVFVAQEKAPPYAAAPYELPKQAVEMGLDLYRRRLELYAKCHNANDWPGYDQNIRSLDLPGWAYRVDVS